SSVATAAARASSTIRARSPTSKFRPAPKSSCRSGVEPMPILPYLDHYPQLAPDFYVAPSGFVIGRVQAGPGSSVWFGAVVRGDLEPITMGEGVNIQEHAVLHTDVGFPTVIGDHSSLGHHAIVHGAVLEDHVLVAMSAIVLSGARIGAGSIIAANAL